MTPSLVAGLAALAVAVVGCDSSQQAARSQSQPPATEVSATPTAGKVRIADAPPGDVAMLVRDALASAEREHRRVVVYVGASWCEPCQRFHRSAADGDLDAEFPDVNLLVFDADRDVDRLNAAGYAWKKYIPLFALPGPDGRASGKQFEGGIKGEGAVSYLAPRLESLLREQ